LDALGTVTPRFAGAENPADHLLLAHIPDTPPYFEPVSHDDSCDYRTGRRQASPPPYRLDAIYCISLQEQPHRTRERAGLGREGINAPGRNTCGCPLSSEGNPQPFRRRMSR